MIGVLDGKIDWMIEKHEKDFITAYRVSILKCYWWVCIGAYVKNIKGVRTFEKEM
jgi:hypothetical protein